MIKKGLWLVVFLFFLIPRKDVLAEGVRLSDSAGMLSTQEFAIAEKNLGYIVERYDITVHLFTSEKIGKKDDYRAYVKKQRKKEKEKDLLLLFLSTKKNGELCYIKAYGQARKNLTKKRLSSIERAVERKLKKEDHKEAVHLLSGRLLDKMGTKPLFDGILFHPFLHFFLCVLLAVGVLYGILRRISPQAQFDGIPYLDEKYSVLMGTLDHFSHISVKPVKTKKKKKKGQEDEDEFSELEGDELE